MIKKIHFTDQNVSSYNINLTMAFLKWPIKTYIWKSGDRRRGVFTTRVSSRHTTHVYLLMQARLSTNQNAGTILVIL